LRGKGGVECQSPPSSLIQFLGCLTRTSSRRGIVQQGLLQAWKRDKTHKSNPADILDQNAVFNRLENITNNDKRLKKVCTRLKTSLSKVEGITSSVCKIGRKQPPILSMTSLSGIENNL
jgi:hypothetical protein